jgi:hypothetical protein
LLDGWLRRVSARHLALGVVSITGIDHVLVAVQSLSSAEQTFARLGFTCTPRSDLPEWGITAHSVVFDGNFIDLVAATGTGSGAEQIRDHLAARGEGLMAAALGSPDAQKASAALRHAGIDAAAPVALSRRVETPEGVMAAHCSVVQLPADAMPGVPAFLCQHLTPDVIRRPAWLNHANGARGILSVTVVVEQPAALMAAYDRIFGPASSTPTDDMVTVHTGGGLLFLVTPDGFGQLHPEFDTPPPAPPALVAIEVAVDDIAATERLLIANGVAFNKMGDHLAVPPADAAGFCLEFIGS